jgi:putative salt-induced outer membrane protein YdiY
MKNLKIAIVGLIGVVSLSAFADKLVLKSGSVLLGKTDVIRDGKVTFNADDIGSVTIPADKIAKLESEAKHVIQYQDGTTENKSVTVAEGKILIESKAVPANVKAIDPIVEKWHGSVNASATATRGNTVGESVSIIANVNRRWENDRFTASAGYFFEQSGDTKEDKQKTVSRFELEAQQDHFWSKKFYSYINGKYEFDKIMELDYRYRIGAGLGYQWFEKKDFGFGAMSFNQELGGAYVAEKYKTVDDNDQFGTFRYGHHYAWNIAAVAGLDFIHDLEYLPAVDEWADNYMINTDTGVTYAFMANWQLIAKVEWDYKSKVGRDTKRSDIRYILGLGYKW